ncbi:MAG: V-type ATP synthase subunit F [Syntrophobacterales bacterium]|nr:MAG: V-type ATP synthase subunit F [Syntrophobacterales bacterium]
MASSNIAVLGDKDSILCFRAIGVSTYPVANSEEAKPILRQLCRENYAVIFVTEPIAREIPDLIDDLAMGPLPSIVLIPNNQGSLGLGMEKIKKTVVRAIGADIFAESEGK